MPCCPVWEGCRGSEASLRSSLRPPSTSHRPSRRGASAQRTCRRSAMPVLDRWSPGAPRRAPIDKRRPDMHAMLSSLPPPPQLAPRRGPAVVAQRPGQSPEPLAAPGPQAAPRGCERRGGPADGPRAAVAVGERHGAGVEHQGGGARPAAERGRGGGGGPRGGRGNGVWRPAGHGAPRGRGCLRQGPVLRLPRLPGPPRGAGGRVRGVRGAAARQRSAAGVQR